VTAFFHFGFQLRTGIVRKEYHNVHTSDWVGPYNIIMAPIPDHPHHDDGEILEAADVSTQGGGNSTEPTVQKEIYVSRYVNTPWTETELQRPFASSGIFNFDAKILEDVAGTKAINETIHIQKAWRGKPPKKCRVRWTLQLPGRALSERAGR
jgi:hypothetical protein